MKKGIAVINILAIIVFIALFSIPVISTSVKEGNRKELLNNFVSDINNKLKDVESDKLEETLLNLKNDENIKCDNIVLTDENKLLLNDCSINNSSKKYCYYGNDIYSCKSKDYKKIYLSLGIEDNINYEVGTLLKVQVGKKITQNVYVLSVDGDKVTAILDRNLGDNTGWVSEENVKDYMKKNNIPEENINQELINKVIKEYGTENLIKHLNNETKDWKNITSKRLPTVLDIMGQTTWYQNLEDKTNWEEEYLKYISKSTNPDCDKTEECRKVLTEKGKGDILIPTWLNVNLYTSGDSTTDNNGVFRYEYWTTDSSILEPGTVYSVSFMGVLDVVFPSYPVGVRPIIEFDKSYVIEQLSQDEKVDDSVSKYEIGHLLNIEVGKGLKYNFRVLEDNGPTMKLIMDKNLGDDIAWEDTEKDDTNLAYHKFQELTKDWEYAIDIDLPQAKDIVPYLGIYNDVSEFASWNEEYEEIYNTALKNTTIKNALNSCKTNECFKKAFNEAGYNKLVVPDWLDRNLATTGDDSTSGYWIDSHGSMTHKWSVSSKGILEQIFILKMENTSGIRPVIVINKKHIVK